MNAITGATSLPPTILIAMIEPADISSKKTNCIPVKIMAMVIAC